MFCPEFKMAATRSVLRFANSTYSTSFSGIKTSVISSKSFQLWSRISFQLSTPARQLSTKNRHQTLAKTMCQKLALPSRPLALSTGASNTLLSHYLANLAFQRGITMVSRKGKRKTCKAVAKRFIRTGKGKLKRWRCGKHHNQTKKSGRRKRFLRKPTYASKTQLKTLNKMLNGW